MIDWCVFCGCVGLFGVGYRCVCVAVVWFGVVFVVWCLLYCVWCLVMLLFYCEL